ncbi:ABC transporter ATP-binding protein [Lichenifustis flavocetrariae]|uniref:ABC transporter ATP-binding protein n=1 Tax=Lichenifustis flavocetrariae TaxID=2949735 RepID=A0AA42CJ68_9HYPH|nr:ABC transporter ATP-binding protein [Lichenifustis flavocetrariae]MCW6509273.1 ABC transporter ATP-binding protein [Lichenifustis flavocetrariae]
MHAPLDATPLLELDGLTVGIGGDAAPILNAVTCTLRRNEILGIVGETGAGKSLLTKAVLGLVPEGLRVLGGDVRFDGCSVFDRRNEDLRDLRGGKIGLIGTNAKALLDPVAPVGRQIARVLRAHARVGESEAQSRAIALLREVGITDPERRAKAYPHELSGGMAQRVVIAMALVTDPAVLLADDATLGLDATVQAQVLDMLVQRCRRRGLGVMLVTHDLGIVRNCCDRIAVMREGELIEIENVDAFLRGPRQAYSRSLLEAAKARPTPSIARHTASERPLLQAEKLVKIYGGPFTHQVRALDGVDFSIRPRETLALVGESGSGKTTAGQCVLRLTNPTSGRILFDGEDVTDLSAQKFKPWRRRIQMVFQEPYVALNPRWRVRDLIGESFRLLDPMSRGERERRISALLDAVHLPSSLASAFPHELSAGEQKRIGIARALATDPDLVIFDEPTTALDIRVRAQIIDLIRDLQSRRGMSALFITHDLNSVRSLAHNVAVMLHGRIVEYRSAEDIFATPREAYTRKLLDAELPVEDPPGRATNVSEAIAV